MKEGSIIEKAYQIDLDAILDGDLVHPIICFSNNIKDARKILLKKAKLHDLKLKRFHSWDMHFLSQINLSNIPVKRCKEFDKVIFEGKEEVRGFIKEILSDRARIAELDKILQNPNIKYCYIIKGAYYRPNYKGYTSIREEAGIYTKEEAVEHAKNVHEIRLECIDIEEHNRMIEDKIIQLKHKILI